MIRIAYIARSGEEELVLMAHFADRNGIFLEAVGGDDQNRQTNLRDYEGVVLLGNLQGVQRQASLDLVREAVDSNLPILGISGGARLLAEICRNSVDAGVPGRGSWSSFRLTEEGRRDTLFFGLSDSCSLYREYGDALVLPSGATVLAVSNSGQPVAFRYGNAYGFDFALPRGRCLFEEEHYRGTDAAESDGDSPDGQACRALVSLARAILGNFLWLTELCRASRPDRGKGDVNPAAM